LFTTALQKTHCCYAKKQLAAKRNTLYVVCVSAIKQRLALLTAQTKVAHKAQMLRACNKRVAQLVLRTRNVATGVAMSRH